MHYSNKQLIDYMQNQVNQSTRDKIDEHLMICDDCMKLYLSLVSPADIADAQNSVPPGFVKTVMTAAEGQKRRVLQNQRGKVKSNWARTGDILPYYIAAAVLTLFLSGSGVFNDIFMGLNSSGRVDHKASYFVVEDMKFGARLVEFMNGITAFADGVFAEEGGVSSE